MELDKHNSVRKRHQSDQHEIHGNGDDTKTSIVCNERLVLAKTMVLDQTSFDDIDKVPVEEGIYKHDENLGTTIPVSGKSQYVTKTCSSGIGLTC